MTVAVALVAGFSVLGANKAQAGAAPTLTIHAMECYSDFDSSTLVLVGEVGANAGSIEIIDFQGAPGAYVYCRDLTENEVLYDGSYADGGGGVAFLLESDDEIVCDIHFIVPAPIGGSSSGGEVSTTTTLPSTGAGDTGASQTMLFMVLVSFLGLVAFGTAAFGVSTRRSR